MHTSEADTEVFCVQKKTMGDTNRVLQSTCGLVAMTSAQHAEGRQFDPGQVYVQNANKA